MQQSLHLINSSIPISLETNLSFMSDTNDSTTIHTNTDELTSLRPDVGPQFQWKEGRNYRSHPITAAESRYLDHQKQQLPAKFSNITTAICHRTLFGNFNMRKIFNWVSYYRLLGFDHIFMWYRPEIAQLPYFDELEALPYVTLTEYTGPANRRNDGQADVEHACLSEAKFAANYTWAFPIDIDEYLWYNHREPIYEYVVNRLGDLHYVSLGKYMYTRKHVVALERNDSGFCLDRYAFTAGPYCYKKIPKDDVCPTFIGRAKILAKPSHHQRVDIHGYKRWHTRPGGTHLPPVEAHLKEFNLYLESFNTTVHPDRTTFYVSRTDEVSTYWTMEAHAKNADGLVPFWYDDGLHDWFRFVAQGCPRDNQSISQH
jgi:hypothetical protein